MEDILLFERINEIASRNNNIKINWFVDKNGDKNKGVKTGMVS